VFPFMRLRVAGARATLVVAAALVLIGTGREATADIVLFTASTDYTLNNPDGGYSFPNDPTQQNPFLPAISSGVTLSQASGGLSNTLVGPLPDGSTYGPFGFAQQAGGTTGWVSTSYTFATSGIFKLVWEVAEVAGAQGGDALTTDNITINGNKIVQFQPGQALPGGFTGLGSFGTSAGVPGLPTSGGDPGFAWMNVQPSSSTGVTPIFDTSGEVFSASQIYSAAFTVSAGDTLSVDVAFLTNDGSPYTDYGAVALQSVPEPSSLVGFALGIMVMTAIVARRRRERQKAG
jgi:hypothetical protein